MSTMKASSDLHGDAPAAALPGIMLDRRELALAEMRPYGERVQVDGSPVALAPEMVQPIALVLHELVANATLHGALSKPSGTIAVRWYSEGNRAILQWREDSVGPVTPPRQVGFGIGMIRGVIGRQLGGSVKLEWAEHGLEADLAFPTETATI